MSWRPLVICIGLLVGCGADGDERVGAEAVAELRAMTQAFEIGPGCVITETPAVSDGLSAWRIEAGNAGKTIELALDEASARARRGREREQDYWYFEASAVADGGQLTWQVTEPGGATLTFEATDAQGVAIGRDDCQ